MPHPNEADARKFRANKLNGMTGKSGEYPPDKASRIAGDHQTNASGQGDASRSPEEVFVRAPSRQVSNYGKVKK